MLKEPHERVYTCHWDNTDDTDADALLTLDFKTGVARVLVGFVHP
jgi:hypothetical protein